MPIERTGKLSSQTTNYVNVYPPAGKPAWMDFAPMVSSATIALGTVIAVHRLTQQRDRRKSVFDLHKLISESTKDLRDCAETGWTTTSTTKRRQAVAATLWHLQRIGGMANQMGRLACEKRWFRAPLTLDPQEQMAALRDAITLGDFDDDTRNQRPSEVPLVRAAITDFLEGLDRELYRWMS